MDSQSALRRSAFTRHLSLLQKAIYQQWLSQTAMWVVVSALTISLIGFFLQKFLRVSVDPLLLYPALVAVAMALTMFYKSKFKKQLEEELALLDQRFHLKALLRTAYEVHRTGKHSFIAGKLIQSATTSFQYIPLKQLYPFHYHRPLLLITVCLLAFFLLYKLPALVPNSIESAFARPTGNNPLEKETENLKPFSKLENLSSPSEIQKPKQEMSQNDLEERVTELTEKTKKSDTLDPQTTQELMLLQNELHRAQNRLTRNLLSQISPELAGKLPSLDDILNSGINPQQIEQIEQGLENSFPEAIPPSLAEGLAALERNQQLNQMLEDSLAQGEEGLNRESRGAAEQEGRQEGANSNKGGANPDSGPSNSMGEGGLQEQTAQGGNDLQRFPGDGMGGFSEEGMGSRAGDQPSNGTRQSPSPVQRARNDISKIKGLSGEGDHTKVQVQTLTTIGTAELSSVTIKRAYEQDLETVFQKEEIPPYHHQLIKNYFLAIGD